MDEKVQSSPLTSPISSFDSTNTVYEEETWCGHTTFITGPIKNSKTSSLIEKSKKRQTKYLESCPEIDRILNRSRMRSHLTTLILNGNISSACSYKKKMYVINNNCPFDSIIVAVAVASVDYDQYSDFIGKTKNEFLNLGKNLGFQGPSKLIYKRRLDLLLPHYEVSTSIPSVNTINAECNVTKVIQDYIKTDPSSYQTTTCSNTNCSREIQIKNSASVILDDLNHIHVKGFSFILKLMEDYIKPKSKPCSKNNCNGILQIRRNLGEHIFIETDTIAFNSSTFTINLKEIPVNIDLNQGK